jgi:hypothetical protein
LIGILTIIILFIPFIVYEINNNWENINNLVKVIFENSEQISLWQKLKFNIIGFVEFLNAIILANFSGLNNNFSFVDNINIFKMSFIPGLLALLGFLVISIAYLFKNKNKSNFLFILFLLQFIFFIFSKKILFIHYYSLFFPITFILLGYLFSFFYKKNILFKMIISLMIFIIFFSNISYTFSYFSGLKNNTWQKHHSVPFYQIKNATDYIVKEAKNDRINLNCEITDYCQSFEYLLDLNNIKIDNNSNNRFRIYLSFDNKSDFRPVQIEKIN